LILIRLYFILTILITEDDVNTHLNHRRIFLCSTPCGVGSLLCMRNINCKSHWLAICCLFRIFYYFLDRRNSYYYRDTEVEVGLSMLLLKWSKIVWCKRSRYFLGTIQHILEKSLKISKGQSESYMGVYFIFMLYNCYVPTYHRFLRQNCFSNIKTSSKRL
jgi:hypothetical protein